MLWKLAIEKNISLFRLELHHFTNRSMSGAMAVEEVLLVPVSLTDWRFACLHHLKNSYRANWISRWCMKSTLKGYKSQMSHWDDFCANQSTDYLFLEEMFTLTPPSTSKNFVVWSFIGMIISPRGENLQEIDNRIRKRQRFKMTRPKPAFGRQGLDWDRWARIQFSQVHFGAFCH